MWNSEPSRLTKIAALAFLSMALSGCNLTAPTGDVLQQDPNPTSPLQTKYYASDEDFQEGVRNFQAGAFGLAQERFQKAVERTPRDANAWMGLAASYDRVRRFDMADRAYDQALKLEGSNVTFLNNRGYSYLLRGDLVNARKYFLDAYRLDPSNPAVINNLHLLDGSRRYVRRTPGAYEPPR